jgi:hypothetical protein
MCILCFNGFVTFIRLFVQISSKHNFTVNKMSSVLNHKTKDKDEMKPVTWTRPRRALWVDTGALYAATEGLWRKAAHLPASAIQNKNTWSHISTCLYGFRRRCLTENRVNLRFAVRKRSKKMENKGNGGDDDDDDNRLIKNLKLCYERWMYNPHCVLDKCFQLTSQFAVGLTCDCLHNMAYFGSKEALVPTVLIRTVKVHGCAGLVTHFYVIAAYNSRFSKTNKSFDTFLHAASHQYLPTMSCGLPAQ